MSTTVKNSLVSSLKTKTIIKYVPPDGGWGWMVLLGTTLSNIFNTSMISLFSLLYGDALEAMGHETQGAALVLSANLFVSNFGGPLAGAIVKLTSPRFTAVMGASFCATGIFVSGFSTNIWHLVIAYGVLLGLGLDFIFNSSFVAINSYFKQKKSRAVGLGTVGTNIGQMLMPHLARYLLENYGFRGTCMILSSLSLHGVAGCMLLQPVERHMKKVVEEVIVEEKIHLLENEQDDIAVIKITPTDEDMLKMNTEKVEMYFVNESGSHVNEDKNGGKINEPKPIDLDVKAVVETEKKTGLLKRLYDLFGIALLSDVRFIIIVMGTALTTTSIVNFSLLYPLFLQNTASMNKHQTATCMSAVAGADMIGRITFPLFQDKFKIKARWMFISAAAFVIISRQILAYQTNLAALIVLSICYGLARSVTVVNKNIAISENCKLEQVPSAVGLGMLSMGIIAPPLGYFLGWIRDYTDSYIVCIWAQNALLVILIATWLPDLLYLHIKEIKQRKRMSD